MRLVLFLYQWENGYSQRKWPKLIPFLVLRQIIEALHFEQRVTTSDQKDAYIQSKPLLVWIQS